MLLKKVATDGWGKGIKRGRPVYIFECSYYDREVAKGAGFGWHNEFRKWWTSSKRAASELRQYADSTCKKELEEYARKEYNKRSGLYDCVERHEAEEALLWFGYSQAQVTRALNRVCETIDIKTEEGAETWIKRALMVV